MSKIKMNTGGGGTTSPLTTKGDLWGYTSTDARLPVGSEGQILKVASGEASGLKWDAAAAGDFVGLTDVDISSLSAGRVIVTNDAGTAIDDDAELTYNSSTNTFTVKNVAMSGEMTGMTMNADNNVVTNIGLDELTTDVEDTIKVADGLSLDTPSVTVASDGSTITLSLEKSGTGDLRYVFSDGIFTLDCTPAATVTLTAGTDTSPQLNYVYLLHSTNQLTVSTSDWPATEYAPIATVVCQSAASLQNDNALKVHAWTDHTYDSAGAGHINHIAKWVRRNHATWISGVAPTFSGDGTGTIGLATSAGVAMQLHDHVFPAFSDPATIYCVNDPDTAYRKITNIASLLKDSAGNNLTNKTYSIVIWGCVSEVTGDCKLFCNLPSGSYGANQETNARNDVNSYTDFSIPANFKGTGFLIYRLVIENNSDSTWDLYDGGTGDDLRGTFPGSSAGSSTGTATEFPDSTFRVFDNADDTKKIAFEASSITTSTVRTLTVADASGTIVTTGNLSAIVETGAVNAGSITSGHGNIDIGTSLFSGYADIGSGEIDATEIGQNAATRGKFTDLHSNGSKANKTPRTITAISDVVDLEDYKIKLDGTSNNVTLNLPTASEVSGRELIVKAINIDNAVGIAGNGAETIDGNAVYYFSGENDSVRIESDGSNWDIW